MTEWVIRFIEEHGYLGVAALMVAENLFPPMPSELIMPFAGFLAARGDLLPRARRRLRRPRHRSSARCRGTSPAARWAAAPHGHIADRFTVPVFPLRGRRGRPVVEVVRRGATPSCSLSADWCRRCARSYPLPAGLARAAVARASSVWTPGSASAL